MGRERPHHSAYHLVSEAAKVMGSGAVGERSKRVLFAGEASWPTLIWNANAVSSSRWPGGRNLAACPTFDFHNFRWIVSERGMQMTSMPSATHQLSSW
jgi:hypothetical protein